MAVKRYFTNDTSPISFPSVTGWDVTGSSAGNALAVAPAGTGAASQGAETSTTNPTDVLVRRFASDQMLSAGDFEGAWSAVIAGNETNAAADGFPRLVIKVVSADGTVTRGSQAFVDGTEWTTTNTGRTVSGTISPAITGCQIGDRLIVEHGWRATNTVNTSYQVNIRRGGTDGTDMAPGDTGTNANARPSFITFSDASADARFAAPALGVTPVTAAATGSAHTPDVTTDAGGDAEATAGPAAASGTAHQPGRAVTISPAAALAAGAAHTPARAGSSRPAGTAAAGSAARPALAQQHTAGAAGAGAAHQPDVTGAAAGQVIPTTASATGTVRAPATAVTVTPSTAAATSRTTTPAPTIATAAAAAAAASAQAFAPARALQVSQPGPASIGQAHAPAFTDPGELTVTPAPARATAAARRPTISAVEPPAAAQPGWGRLEAILAPSWAPPQARRCPYCGTRLREGPSGRPYCPFDGLEPDGTGPPPAEPDPRSWGGLRVTSTRTTDTTSSSNDDRWEGWGP